MEKINLNPARIGETVWSCRLKDGCGEVRDIYRGRYLVSDPPNGILLFFEPEELEPDFMAAEKEKFEKAKVESEAFWAKQRDREEKEAAAKAAREDLRGFTDGMTKMQAGKVLKILMVEEVYNHKYVTRRDYIETLLEIGCTIEAVTRNGKKEWRMLLPTGYICGKTTRGEDYATRYHGEVFYNINKTMYDYAAYMINRKAVQAA